MELIMESIKQDLSEIRKQRKRYQDSYAKSSISVRHRKMHRERGVFWLMISRIFTFKVIAIWTLLGAGVVIASLILAGRIESNPESAQMVTDSILNAGRQNMTTSSSGLPAISDTVQVLGTSLPLVAGQTSRKASAEGKPRQASLGTTTSPGNTSVNATATSIASLRKFARAETGAHDSTILGNDFMAIKATGIEGQDHVANTQPAVGEGKEGIWALNLVSLSSRAGADRIAADALSRGIKTEQQQATVNGKHYWRVQITGFSTAEEAAAYADTAKETLGLKDIWITKR
jgi:hypothetical protein